MTMRRRDGVWPGRGPGRSGALLLVAGALGLAACQDSTGGSLRPMASLTLQPELPQAVTPGVFDLAVDRVRIRILRPPAEPVIDTTVLFPLNASQLAVRLRIPLVARRERLTAAVELSAGQSLLFAGADTIEVSETESVAPVVRMLYVGPGANLTSLRIAPRDTALKPGDTFSFLVGAMAGSTTLDRFYVAWSTGDPTTAPVTAVGTLTAPGARGSTMLRVVAPNGIKDSTRVWFAPPAHSAAVISGANQTGTAGRPLPQPLAIRVLSLDGLGTPGVRVRFRALGGGRVRDSLVTTDGDGIALTVADLGPVATLQSFEATATGFTPLFFTTIAEPGPPSRIEAFAGNGQVDSVGRALSTSLIARVTDFVGNPVAGVTVSWSVVSGGGTIARFSNVTNPNGFVFADLVLGPAPGPNVVRATVALPALAVDFTATAVAASPAAIVAVAGMNQADTAGAVLSPFAVAVADAFGNPVRGAQVRWSEVQGGGTLSPAASLTDEQGRASTSYRLPFLAGNVNVVAEVPGPQAVSVLFQATVRPAAPTRIAIASGNGQTAPASAQLAPLAVLVQDQYGNPVPGAQVAWQVVSGGGTVSAGATLADAAGVARVVHTLGPTPGANSVRAALDSGPSVTFSATATP